MFSSLRRSILNTWRSFTLYGGIQKTTTNKKDTADLLAEVLNCAKSVVRIYAHSLTGGVFTCDVVVGAMERAISRDVKIMIVHDAPQAYPEMNIQTLMSRTRRSGNPDSLRIRVLPAGRQDGRHFLLADTSDIVEEMVPKDSNGNMISAMRTATSRLLSEDMNRFETLWSAASDI